MSSTDYELLNILDKNTNSRIFKVRHKSTGEHFVWYTINCENLINQQLILLDEKFISRKAVHHPNLLEFYDLIKEEGSELYYLVVKYCKHGSLKDMMDMAFNDGKRFSEEFLCKILYQIAFAIKTLNLSIHFDIKEIFFDDDYNIKLFQFNLSKDKAKPQKISSLGTLIFEVCTLMKFSKKCFEKELKNCNSYTKEFLTLLTAMIKDSRDLKKNIDKVMCNSTLLLKITQWSKYKCFVKIEEGNNTQTDISEELYAVQIKKLAEKKIILQEKENFLKEREHKISTKEKKLAFMEKRLKETIKQVEEAKISIDKKCCTCSSKISDGLDQGEPIKENLDSTYISCGDSVIMPTSKKLNVKEIIKPATFTRTLSEKRIRFKGHSPLKEIDFNRRRSVRHIRTRKDTHGKNDWVTCSEDTDKSTLVSTKSVYNKKFKQLFHTYQNNGEIILNEDVAKPIKWTEENKKHAFELLRIMNKDTENKPPDVKHTYL